MWHRSSRCASGSCVEVAFNGHLVLVRDSKNPDGPVLEYTCEEWGTDILTPIRERRTPDDVLTATPPKAAALLRQEPVLWVRGDVTLGFSVREWQAFEAGVRAGDLNVDRQEVTA